MALFNIWGRKKIQQLEPFFSAGKDNDAILKSIQQSISGAIAKSLPAKKNQLKELAKTIDDSVASHDYETACNKLHQFVQIANSRSWLSRLFSSRTKAIFAMRESAPPSLLTLIKLVQRNNPIKFNFSQDHKENKVNREDTEIKTELKQNKTQTSLENSPTDEKIIAEITTKKLKNESLLGSAATKKMNTNTMRAVTTHVDMLKDMAQVESDHVITIQKNMGIDDSEIDTTDTDTASIPSPLTVSDEDTVTEDDNVAASPITVSDDDIVIDNDNIDAESRTFKKGSIEDNNSPTTTIDSTQSMLSQFESVSLKKGITKKETRSGSFELYTAFDKNKFMNSISYLANIIKSQKLKKFRAKLEQLYTAKPPEKKPKLQKNESASKTESGLVTPEQASKEQAERNKQIDTIKAIYKAAAILVPKAGNSENEQLVITDLTSLTEGDKNAMVEKVINLIKENNLLYVEFKNEGDVLIDNGLFRKINNLIKTSRKADIINNKIHAIYQDVLKEMSVDYSDQITHDSERISDFVSLFAKKINESDIKISQVPFSESFPFDKKVFNAILKNMLEPSQLINKLFDEKTGKNVSGMLSPCAFTIQLTDDKSTLALEMEYELNTLDLSLDELLKEDFQKEGLKIKATILKELKQSITTQVETINSICSEILDVPINELPIITDDYLLSLNIDKNEFFQTLYAKISSVLKDNESNSNYVKLTTENINILRSKSLLSILIKNGLKMDIDFLDAMNAKQLQPPVTTNSTSGYMKNRKPLPFAEMIKKRPLKNTGQDIPNESATSTETKPDILTPPTIVETSNVMTTPDIKSVKATLVIKKKTLTAPERPLNEPLKINGENVINIYTREPAFIKRIEDYLNTHFESTKEETPLGYAFSIKLKQSDREDITQNITKFAHEMEEARKKTDLTDKEINTNVAKILKKESDYKDTIFSNIKKSINNFATYVSNIHSAPKSTPSLPTIHEEKPEQFVLFSDMFKLRTYSHVFSNQLQQSIHETAPSINIKFTSDTKGKQQQFETMLRSRSILFIKENDNIYKMSADAWNEPLLKELNEYNFSSSIFSIINTNPSKEKRHFIQQKIELTNKILTASAPVKIDVLFPSELNASFEKAFNDAFPETRNNCYYEQGKYIIIPAGSVAEEKFKNLLNKLGENAHPEYFHTEDPQTNNILSKLDQKYRLKITVSISKDNNQIKDFFTQNNLRLMSSVVDKTTNNVDGSKIKEGQLFLEAKPNGSLQYKLRVKGKKDKHGKSQSSVITQTISAEELATIGIQIKPTDTINAAITTANSTKTDTLFLNIPLTQQDLNTHLMSKLSNVLLIKEQNILSTRNTRMETGNDVIYFIDLQTYKNHGPEFIQQIIENNLNIEYFDNSKNAYDSIDYAHADDEIVAKKLPNDHFKSSLKTRSRKEENVTANLPTAVNPESEKTLSVKERTALYRAPAKPSPSAAVSPKTSTEESSQSSPHI